MVTLMRSDVKRMLKKDSFWKYFPEYQDLKPEVMRSGCCTMAENIYQDILSKIQRDIKKWKLYLNTDQIRIFVGNRTSIL